MTNTDDTLQAAVAHHQAGRLNEAAALYRQILTAEPRHAEATHLLGLVAHQQGRHEEAIRLITGAIRVEGGRPLYHNNLGEAYRACGMLAEAQASFEHAIRIDPAAYEPRFNLALVHRTQGDPRAAAERCRQALAIKPDHVAAQYLLAAALWQLGDRAGAQAGYERVLVLDARHFDALANLGTLLRERGEFARAGACLDQARALRPDSAELCVRIGDLDAAQSRWPSAIAAYQTALRLDPRLVMAEVRLGTAHQAIGQHDEAATHYRRAIELEPRHVTAKYNLATALESLGRRDEAARHYQATLKLDPRVADAHLNLGAYYQETNPEQALTHYEQALALDPDSAKAHFNRALILLSRGDLPAGWREFEWRTRLPGFPVRKFPWPPWSGGPIANQTLLVHSEQGLGDTLQFIRYVQLARGKSARVLTLVHPPLVTLLRHSGFEDVTDDETSLSGIDCQAPMISLPGLLGTTLDNIPAPIPYLFADAALVASWRDRLRGLEGFRVGICWQGSATQERDALRSIPLEAFESLARIPHVQLISLQKHQGVEQLRELKGEFAVHELGDDWDEAAGPFMDTAAVIKNLDLVVVPDTAIAHLAGALGAPVWVALAARADWRWMQDRSVSPWYPTMRLFRQSSGGWNELFDRMAAELQQLVARAIAQRGTGSS